MKISWVIFFVLTVTSLVALSLMTSCGDDEGESSSDGDTDGDTDGDSDGVSDPDASSEGLFGDPCEVSEDCHIPDEENVCHEFGQLGKVCTFTCENDDDCPDGSEGQKCNNSNVCRP